MTVSIAILDAMVAALTVHIKIVIGHVLATGNSGTSVVTQMENPGLDSKPTLLVNMGLINTRHSRRRNA